jgi:hypothetical protein
MVEVIVRYRFSANIWCRVIEGQIMGQFIMEGRLLCALCFGVAEGGGRFRYHRFVILDSVTLAARAGMCSRTSSMTEYPPYQSAFNALSELSLNGSLVWPWGPQNWPLRSPVLNPTVSYMCASMVEALRNNVRWTLAYT